MQQATLVEPVCIRFTVYGAPVAQPRQRHTMIAGHAHNYTPTKHPVQQFKADVKMAAQAAGLPPELLIGPIGLELTFYLPRPKALMRKKDPDRPIPCYGAMDWDNLSKAVTDALTGVLWHDDRQIADARVRKRYCEKSGRPRVEIGVRRIGAEEAQA